MATTKRANQPIQAYVAKLSYTEKLSPHPQVRVALGFTN